MIHLFTSFAASSASSRAMCRPTLVALNCFNHRCSKSSDPARKKKDKDGRRGRRRAKKKKKKKKKEELEERRR